MGSTSSAIWGENRYQGGDRAVRQAQERLGATSGRGPLYRASWTDWSRDGAHGYGPSVWHELYEAADRTAMESGRLGESEGVPMECTPKGTRAPHGDHR